MTLHLKYYTVEEIAESLGVNTESVRRWVESGKLRYSCIEKDVQKFTVENLTEFAEKYNISMKFLDSANNHIARKIKNLSSIAIAK